MARHLLTFAGVALAVALAGAAASQTSIVPPLGETRLAVSTLVREDIFAGFQQNDMTRLARGEANIEQLLKDRPKDRAALLAWRAGAKVDRAVLAKEAGKMADYARYYISATADMNEALDLHSADNAVPAVIGGVGVNFGDRLAKADQAANWERTYAAYKGIYAQQGPIADKLPPHLRGELMGGLVTAAQRSGRDAEVAPLLDKMLVVVKGTPYEATALSWKSDPKSMATTNLACKNCHDAGRLAPMMGALAPKPS